MQPATSVEMVDLEKKDDLDIVNAENEDAYNENRLI